MVFSQIIRLTFLILAYGKNVKFKLFFYILNNFFYKSSRLEVFCKKGVLKNFAKFTEKHLCQSIFFNKVAGLRQNFQKHLFLQNSSGGCFWRFRVKPASLLKKRLWDRCFPVNFVKVLNNTFFTEHLQTTAFVFCYWLYSYDSHK